MADIESQSGHAYLRKSEGGGGIVPKYQDPVNMCKNAVSVDKSKEDQGKNEEVSVSTIDLTVTSEYDPISVDNIDDELFATTAPIETSKISYKPATANLSSSSSTTRTASTSSIYPSAALPADLTTFQQVARI